jgi:hypothetical protein
MTLFPYLVALGGLVVASGVRVLPERERRVILSKPAS